MDQQRIKNTMAKSLAVPVDRLTGGANFVADLGCDSLDLIEMVMALEDEFGLECPDERFENVATVQQAVDLTVQLALEA